MRTAEVTGAAMVYDFARDFSIENGDLIYGIDAVRREYQVCPGLSIDQIDAMESAWVTIDDYNSYFETHGRLADFGFLSGQHGVNDYIYSKFDFSLSEQALAYGRALPQSRFSPSWFYGKAPNSYIEEGRNTGLQNFRAKSLRRACKFGIEMVATEKEFVLAGAKIRFALDGIDMKAVAAKDKRARPGAASTDIDVVPITSSELRYVFRQWERLQQVVKFYVNYQEVAAPWTADWTYEDLLGNGSKTSSCMSAWNEYRSRRGQPR